MTNYIDQAPGQLDIGVYQGDDTRYALLLKSGSPSTPVDLTGATGRAQIRTHDGPDTLVVSWTVTVTDQSVPANLGVVIITLSSSQTTNLPEDTDLWWDLELTQGGNVRTWVKGAITVLPEVSKT